MQKIFTLVRFGVSGAVAFIANISLLYFFKNALHINPVVASGLAAFCAFWVSLYFQKVFTFRKKFSEDFWAHFVKFVVVCVVNSFVTAGLFSVFYRLQYPVGIAQALAAIIVALYSFFIYKFLIFTDKPTVDTVTPH